MPTDPLASASFQTPHLLRVAVPVIPTGKYRRTDEPVVPTKYHRNHDIWILRFGLWDVRSKILFFIFRSFRCIIKNAWRELFLLFFLHGPVFLFLDGYISTWREHQRRNSLLVFFFLHLGAQHYSTAGNGRGEPWDFFFFFRVSSIKRLEWGFDFLYTGYGAKRVFCFLSLILSSIISCFFFLFSFFFSVLALSGVLFLYTGDIDGISGKGTLYFYWWFWVRCLRIIFNFSGSLFCLCFFSFFLFLFSFLAGWRMASMFFFFDHHSWNLFFFKCGMEFFLSDKWWGRGARGVAVFFSSSRLVSI